MTSNYCPLRLELHCHSTHSDGSFAADEVARRAAAFGVRLFCLTDHDTDAGWSETLPVLEPTGCTVLRGLELSCRAYDRTVHILVYGLRPGPGLDQLSARLREIHRQREERVRRICDRLARLGFPLDVDAILRGAEGRTAGRPDVALALVRARICTSPKEAFDRFLKDGGPADVPLDRLSVEEGVALGRAAGARMSLAHPHTLGERFLVRDLFVRHRDQGLEGIEAYYGKYARVEVDNWLMLAKEMKLVPTGGSDFHGEMTPEIARPGIELPDPAAQRLHDWLGV